MKQIFAPLWKTPLPLVILIGLLNLYFGAVYQFTEPQRWVNIFSSDSEGYYLYLPAGFLYGFIDVPVSYLHQAATTPVLLKYTYGVALLEAPFFGLAHLLAPLFHYANNGFTEPYALGILTSTTFYACVGLYLVGNMLQKRFGGKVAWISILSLYLGTNLLYYMMKEPGMSHAYSFFLIALFLHLLEKQQKHPKNAYLLILGLVYGLICVIRPTNAVVGLSFLFWNDFSFSGLKHRLQYATQHLKKTVLIVAGMVLVLIPQLLYWQYSRGEWIAYSYGEEGFHNWNNPKILSVLFSVQNGWLVYSPIMGFALLGLGWMLYKKAQNGKLILLLFVLATYTFSSWWAWWFGGAYGHRCYIDFLPFLAFPLGYFVYSMRKKSSFLQYSLLAIALLFCYYNLGMTYWYNYSAPWDGANWSWARWSEIAGRLIGV